MAAEDIYLIKKLLKQHTASGLFTAFSGVCSGGVSFCISSFGKTVYSFNEGYSGGFHAEYPLLVDGAEAGTLSITAESGQWRGIGDALYASIQTIIDNENAKRAVTSETLKAYRELSLLQRVTGKLSRELKTSEIGRILLEESGFSFFGGEVGAVFELLPSENRFSRLACNGKDADGLFGHFSEQAYEQLFKEIDTIQIINDFDLSLALGTEPKMFRSVIVIPFIDTGKYLGFMLVASPVNDSYKSSDKQRMEIISSVASAALHNAILFEEQKELFNSFLNAIATAIDSKSTYTAGHCKRVPWIARELLIAANDSTSGKFSDFSVSEEEIEELNVAALLHDCGKISTPEWVMDKAVKLEGVIDGIEIIRLKIEIYKFNLLMNAYRRAFGNLPENSQLKDAMSDADNDFMFLSKLNFGGEHLSDGTLHKLSELAQIGVYDADGIGFPLLSEDEIEKLSILRGTLTPAERNIIEEHVVKTVKMLNEIKFPDNMSRVTVLAGMHHEKLDGSGYPYGKCDSDLCIKARIIAIADIFEALTAEDRPYKKPGTISRALDIMGSMVRERHIDTDLFELLVASGIHKKYALEFLPPEMLDI